MIFGWYPIIILKKKGGVEEGKSYVYTTKIVDTGLYSIVRHPQYIAGILFGIALALISQHWAIIMVGIFMIVFLYIDILMDDRYQVEKFGAEYKTYMQKVPRTNFILGCIRLIRSINK